MRRVDGHAMVLLIDNYDSFVHNLARYVRELGQPTRVVRHDRISVRDALALRPSHLIVSPGPCTPREAGVSCALIAAAAADLPVLGVCLGHQCVAEAYGGRIERAVRPVHGRASAVHHDGEGLFRGIPSPFQAGRYHSLVVPAGAVPPALRVVATSGEGEVMAVRHRERPVWGVQFHPESVLTEHGHALLANFLAESRAQQPPALLGATH